MIMNDNNIDFVARHYRRGAFSAKAGWRRLGISSPLRWYRRVAAAVAVAAVLGATATFIYRQYDAESRPDVVLEVQTRSRYAVRAIDFDDAPLSVVVAEIEAVYGVKVAGLPDDADSYTLTLHYEGNADELVAAINDILDTGMYID